MTAINFYWAKVEGQRGESSTQSKNLLRLQFDTGKEQRAQTDALVVYSCRGRKAPEMTPLGGDTCLRTTPESVRGREFFGSYGAVPGVSNAGRLSLVCGLAIAEGAIELTYLKA